MSVGARGGRDGGDGRWSAAARRRRRRAWSAELRRRGAVCSVGMVRRHCKVGGHRGVQLASKSDEVGAAAAACPTRRPSQKPACSTRDSSMRSTFSLASTQRGDDRRPVCGMAAAATRRHDGAQIPAVRARAGTRTRTSQVDGGGTAAIIASMRGITAVEAVVGLREEFGAARRGENYVASDEPPVNGVEAGEVARGGAPRAGGERTCARANLSETAATRAARVVVGGAPPARGLRGGRAPRRRAAAPSSSGKGAASPRAEASHVELEGRRALLVHPGESKRVPSSQRIAWWSPARRGGGGDASRLALARAARARGPRRRSRRRAESRGVVRLTA